jgi:2-aminoadipate transaminase
MLIGQKDKVKTDLWNFAPHIYKLEASIIREILKISCQPGVINFAGGLPASELFPLEQLQKCMIEVTKKHGQKAFQYSLSMGIPELRELIAERATQRGSVSKADNILVTNGSQQAIELIARVFIDKGDYILTENPTYLGALQAFNYYQAHYTTVEMDNDGMIIEQVEEKIKKYNPKLIYTVSNFQNPTGISLSKQRRIELIDLATSYNIPILDDNPYGEIIFTGEKIPTLKSYGGDEVIAVRSFSKIISPGLRVGWINAHEETLAYFEKVKQCTDLHTTSFGQYLIYEYMKNGYLDPHIEIIRADYKAKRDIMLKTIRETFPDGVTWTEPNGGFFLWVELPSHVSAKDLLPKAVERKVAYVYGQPFYPNGGGENTLRLNFCNATLENIVEGISRLAELFKENM